MGNEGIALEGLSAFSRIDGEHLGDLTDRDSFNRGLAYFRDYAVESLKWDEVSGRVLARVSGSQLRPYQVQLWVKDAQLYHRCECKAWKRFGSCKHVVAAAAAMMAATQGINVLGREIPEDYLVELRAGLGLPPDGGFERGPEDEPTIADVGREVRVHEFGAYGGMRLRINGQISSGLLQSAGAVLPSDFAGGFSREFILREIQRSLPHFLRKMELEGIPVLMRTSEGEVSLSMAPEPLEVRLEVENDGRNVIRRLRFFDSGEGEIVVEERLGAQFALGVDGTIYELSREFSHVDWLPGNKLVESFDLPTFNARAATQPYDTEARGLTDLCEFRRHGLSEPPERLDDSEIGLTINGSIYKNAAGEPEALKYDCSAEIGGVRVDFGDLVHLCLEPLLHAHAGGLFAAKRRVRSLLDLCRRFLADDVTEEEPDFARYLKYFPELDEVAYRGIVVGILRELQALIGRFEAPGVAIAAEPETGNYIAYAVPIRRLAMLLFSIAAVESRRGIHELAGGAIPIKRGNSGSEALRLLLQSAKHLDVAVTIDELPVRRERISISVDAKAAGTDIDWFALHPTIACGENTIDQVEWWRLLRGDLLLQAEDGSWIIPETEESEAGSLRALADMLRVEIGRTRKGRGAVKVSRLEILDWISLRRLGINLELPQEAESLFASLLELKGLPDFEPSSRLKAELRPYQKDGCAWVEFLFRHRFGACLADDMGLGKTVQTIAFLQKSFELGLLKRGSGAPVLIVLPPSLVFNWIEEWERFAPEIRVADCLDKSLWGEVLADADVVLTTYDRVRLDIAKIRSRRFEVVVFDEAHSLKNTSAARTKSAMQLSRRFTLCLTGTPVENNASEFYSVMSTAVPGIFGTLKHFRDVFREEPDRILGRARPFILRRTKTALLKELPKKEEHVLRLEMTAVQKEIYTRTVAEVREEIAQAYVDKPEQQAGIVALAAILRLRQVCVSPTLLGKELAEPAPKLSYLADKLEELKAEGHAALVFSQFLGGLDGLEQIAEERGLDYLRMDGSTPMGQRKEIVQRFQSEDGPSFFFVSLKTGGVGLNLTKANYVFHLDPWWNPAVENQATDRAHRIGQERNVFVQRLIMQHSIEARMMELKDRKAELFHQLVEQPGAETAKAGLSREDFEYLLESVEV